MAASSEWTPSILRPVRIIRGLGLPTKYACFPVASSIGATKARQAGMIPVSVGPVRSEFVATKRAPFVGGLQLLKSYHNYKRGFRRQLRSQD